MFYCEPPFCLFFTQSYLFRVFVISSHHCAPLAVGQFIYATRGTVTMGTQHNLEKQHAPAYQILFLYYQLDYAVNQVQILYSNIQSYERISLTSGITYPFGVTF